MSLIDKMLQASEVEAGGVGEDPKNTFKGQRFQANRIRYKSGVDAIHIYRIWKGDIIQMDRNAANYVVNKVVHELKEFNIAPEYVEVRIAGTKDQHYIQMVVRDRRAFGYAYDHFLKETIDRL